MFYVILARKSTFRTELDRHRANTRRELITTSATRLPIYMKVIMQQNFLSISPYKKTHTFEIRHPPMKEPAAQRSPPFKNALVGDDEDRPIAKFLPMSMPTTTMSFSLTDKNFARTRLVWVLATVHDQIQSGGGRSMPWKANASLRTTRFYRIHPP